MTPRGTAGVPPNPGGLESGGFTDEPPGSSFNEKTPPQPVKQRDGVHKGTHGWYSA